jgi:restriction system protein
MNPLIKAPQALGGSGSIEEIYTKTIELLALPDSVVSHLHDPEKSTQTEVRYRLAWARTYLKKFGLLENSARGVWALTERARVTDNIDCSEVVRVVRTMDRAEATDIPKGRRQDETVQELSEQDDWKNKLFTTLTQRIDPSAFERLVQRLLRESGFIQVEVTGRTGDAF